MKKALDGIGIIILLRWLLNFNDRYLIDKGMFSEHWHREIRRKISEGYTPTKQGWIKTESND